MGYEHGFPRALIHGPEEMGGAEIPHLFSEMMGMKIEAIISHVRANTVLGKSIKINIDHLQLCSGLAQPIFTSKDYIGYIDENWLTHVRNYIITINGTLDTKDTSLPTKQRENNLILMDEFKSLGFKDSELKIINNWRLFFQVSTLVDICTPDGFRIQQCFLEFPAENHINVYKENESSLQWPTQRKSGRKSFNLWSKCIRTCINVYGKNKINYNFGKWMDSNILRKLNKWIFYFQPNSGRLYKKTNGGFIIGEAKSKRKNSSTYDGNDKPLITSILPTDCIQAEVSFDRKRELYTATFNDSTSSKIQLKRSPEDWQDSFTANTIINDASKIREMLLNEEGTIYIVSDGGVYNYEATYGLVISNGDTIVAQNNGKMYSVDFYESSYRSELYAMLAGLLTFKAINDEYGRHQEKN
jgi:hypothetical protein